MSRKHRTRLYFASDLHGSEKCFRKFLNAGAFYKADVLVLGGDLAGKAIQAIFPVARNRHRCTFRGASYELDEGPELDALEQLIADHGYYPYRAEPGELDRRQEDGTLDELFLDLMKMRLVHWLELADERLRPAGIPVYWMLGNDDPRELDPILDAAPWGVHADGNRTVLPSGHELVSCGWSNITPWHSYRELPEAALETMLEGLCGMLERPEHAICNFHVPPYDTGIDEAPVLDSDLTVQASTGQVKMAPAGSTAVREVLEQVQPMLGLHGHIHEAAGFRMLGRTLVVNPGSDYGTGALNGVLVTLEPDRIKAHQFVRG